MATSGIVDAAQPTRNATMRRRRARARAAASHPALSAGLGMAVRSQRLFLSGRLFRAHPHLRWALILLFMVLKAGLIVAVFMHMAWERLALVYAIFLPLAAILVFLAMMVLRGELYPAHAADLL